MDDKVLALFQRFYSDPGDEDLRDRLKRELARLGVFKDLFPSMEDDEDPLDLLEFLEEDLRLYERPRRPGNWCSCAWCCGKNSKRKTLRSYRQPSASRGCVAQRIALG